MDKKEKEVNKMDCYSCAHFYVTWDKYYPKGCKNYQFKTVGMPSAQVKKAIGADCPGYKKKNLPHKNG